MRSHPWHVANNAPHLNDRPTFVYRCFDPAGDLLYIGATHDLEVRLGAHRSTAEWFPLVARVDAERHPDRPSALDAEVVAIAAERPRYNATPRRARTLPPITVTDAAVLAPVDPTPAEAAS